MIVIYYILHWLKYVFFGLLLALIPGIGIFLTLLVLLGSFFAAASDAKKSVQKRKDREIAARFESVLRAQEQANQETEKE